jgi:hypothetical protein
MELNDGLERNFERNFVEHFGYNLDDIFNIILLVNASRMDMEYNYISIYGGNHKLYS